MNINPYYTSYLSKPLIQRAVKQIQGDYELDKNIVFVYEDPRMETLRIGIAPTGTPLPAKHLDITYYIQKHPHSPYMATEDIYRAIDNWMHTMNE